MARRRTCAACGERIDGYCATVWQGDRRLDFHHGDERSCYDPPVMLTSAQVAELLGAGWVLGESINGANWDT